MGRGRERDVPMSDYTPTTEQMREWFSEPQSEAEAMSVDAHYEKAESFDRWLAKHDAEVKAGMKPCAWCDSPATGEALHNDGFMHPTCGEFGHSMGQIGLG